MRVGGILFRGCVLTAILGSCSTAETRTADYTVQTDKDSIARVTGTWSFNDTIIEICDDPATAFCATDRCTSTPCHDITRDGKAEKLSYETYPGGGCDGCYGCECFDVRAGVAITARMIRDGRMNVVTGAAVHRGRVGESKDRGWLLEVYNSSVARTATTVPSEWEIKPEDGGGDVLLGPSTSSTSFLPDRYVKTKGGVCP